MNSGNLLLNAVKVGHKFDYPLFENIDLTLNEKETIAILGISGSGKSTLLHILSSFIKPGSGNVYIQDEDLYSAKSSKLDTLRREYLGIIFQQHYLFRGFTGMENLLSASYLSHEPIDKELLNRLGILEVIEQNATELSGGQQQRVSVARVLTKRPRIIYADEPTGNLDKSTAKDVMDTLFEYVESAKAGMILVTHDEELAKKCDRVLLLEDMSLKEVKNR